MRFNNRRRTMAVAAVGGLVLSGLGTTAAEARNPNNSEKLTQAVTVDAVWEHLEAFQEIADANDDNRAAGTSGYVASAEYVAEQLEAVGYDVERQYFDFLYQETLEESLTVAATGADIDTIVMSYSPNTPEGGLTGELVAPSTATGCDAAAWDGVDATGKIALISRGGCTFAAKSLAAAAAGAVGAIIYNNGDGPLNGTLGGENDAFVPTSGILKSAGEALLVDMADGSPVTVTLNLQQIMETRTTYNVLAETATGRDDNVVMLGAHLDGVTEGAGINDNGTGSAAILETAIQLADVNKLNNKVRFAWWSAEELGLVGSTHYVDTLSDEELGNIATYLNFDMVGSPNYIIGVYDADESTYDAPVTVPAGSAETEDVFTDYFDAGNQPWVDTMFSGRSDYQAFIENGVPASGLFTGADGVKTAEQAELFGGTAGITYDPNYHSAADDITNVNRTALEIMSDAIAHAAITLAQDTSAINGARSAGKSGNPHPQGPVTAEEEPAA